MKPTGFLIGILGVALLHQPAVAAEATCAQGKSADLTAPELQRALAGATLTQRGETTVTYSQERVSTKVSSALHTARMADGQTLVVKTTCTLKCTGTSCSMGGCDIFGTNCTTFYCSGSGCTGGSCTKESSSQLAELDGQ